MQSSGGLTDAAGFRGPNAILSGPAGGVVACAEIAARSFIARVIGFDMGGTSTDVCRFDGDFELSYERSVAGQRVRAPSLAVHSVAAGGGSICRFDGYKLTVGPDSAGAMPGPLCYGRAEARELSVTDLNLALGRVLASSFPFPLDSERPRRALQALSDELRSKGHELHPEALAEGFLEIADQHMAEAIREISVAKGYDVRDYALVVFGGAGGQHACSIARRLGIKTILFHPLAGVLSAYGIGLSEVTYHGEREVRGLLLEGGQPGVVEPLFEELEKLGKHELARELASGAKLDWIRRVDLRYRGTETRITLRWAPFPSLAREFEQRHAGEFGHRRPGHPIELVAARVTLVARRSATHRNEYQSASALPVHAERARFWYAGRWLEDVPIRDRGTLGSAPLAGPALILESTGTIVLEPGFEVRLGDGDILIAERVDDVAVEPGTRLAAERSSGPDPVMLEIMGHAFMAIAEQMGQALRRTAVSTNIRERLDFSCAVFDRGGGLVANAPHIPVHLGAMSESVRAVLAQHPGLEAGDAFVTNDPSGGGSHLPDLTVVLPVHDSLGKLCFFVATRGHHADIGGITPGSMPAFSHSLEQEGIVLSGLRIVHRQHFLREELLTALGHGSYPARRPLENIGDIEAQLAAARTGAELLRRLMHERGAALVERYMQLVQDDAALRVQRAFQALGDVERSFADE
ncbi:MAG TPA: hydantoinase B/oxoprolinase family protein, partial [Polyangiaceae bacterium]|nr:hydantoinase B/oxoprolinase family protein [Polyangiaceae bacterium]